MPHEKALESAIYLGDEWTINHELSINAGVRYSIFNVLGPRSYNIYPSDVLPLVENIITTDSAGGILKTYHGPEFRLSARYVFSDRMSVKACVNSMRQYIHKISNTTIMSPTDIWKLSDMNILPQNGMQIAAGVFRTDYDNMFESSVELYYKTMNHYLDYRPGAELVMNRHLETDLVETEGVSYGAELMIKKVKGKLNGWVSYTYSRTLLRQTDPRITLPVNFGDWYPADFDKPHEVKFVGNYKFTRRYSVSMNCDYSTGRPITIPVAKYRYVGGEYVYYTERNKLRVPDFFRIDLSFNIEPSHHLTLLTHDSFSFGVYNLTGRNNAYSVYYILDGRQIKGYKLAIFGVPIPYISYNIKF
jgi:outer membrane receptor protein involved in Fe transport